MELAEHRSTTERAHRAEIAAKDATIAQLRYEVKDFRRRLAQAEAEADRLRTALQVLTGRPLPDRASADDEPTLPETSGAARPPLWGAVHVYRRRLTVYGRRQCRRASQPRPTSVARLGSTGGAVAVGTLPALTWAAASSSCRLRGCEASSKSPSVTGIFRCRVYAEASHHVAWSRRRRPLRAPVSF